MQLLQQESHFERVCRKKLSQQQHSTPAKTQRQKRLPKCTHHVEEDPEELVPETEYDMLTLQDQSTKPCTVEVELNGIPVAMELDTRAAVSIINESTFSKSAEISLSFFAAFNQQIRTYTGQSIEALGVTQLQVRYKTQDACVAVHIVKGST